MEKHDILVKNIYTKYYREYTPKKNLQNIYFGPIISINFDRIEK